MTCSACNDTGSLSKDVDGMLDCPHCDVARERVRLNVWDFKFMAKHPMESALWLAFQRGRASAGQHQ